MNRSEMRSGGGADPAGDAAVGLLSRAARQAADHGVAAAPSAADWERLQVGRARRERAARLRTGGAALAAVVLIAGAVGGRLWLGRAAELSYVVDGASLGEGGYIHEVGGRGARVRFSEGTEVRLDAGARASIVSSGPEGARLRLESGRGHFEVFHRANARWSVEAGPYSIAVTGTIFDVRWAGADEQLEVSLLRGAVTVRGPLAGEGVTLRPGQRLIADGRARQFRIEELAPRRGTGATADVSSPAGPAGVVGAKVAAGAAGPATPAPTTIAAAGGVGVRLPSTEPAGAGPDENTRERSVAFRRLVAHLRAHPQPAGTAAAPAHAPASGSAMATTRPEPATPAVAAAPAAAPPAVVAPPAAPATEEAVAPAPASGPADWSQRVAKGDFRGVLRAAEQFGIGACVASCDRSALGALADAARYAGDSELARRALLAARGRFPGSPSAQAAAFLLGRIADEAERNPRDALRWYERYLDEAPDGAYAAEALGRKMLVVDRLGDRASAARIAAEYLRRFPNGSYLPQATMFLK